jgi:two-component system cell cycle response regulator
MFIRGLCAGELLVTGFLDVATRVFSEDAFRHMLSREMGRAARYQDSFSLCLLKPDVDQGSEERVEEIKTAISKKIPEFVRSTDMVGRLAPGIGIVLLYTSGEQAIRVANRIRTHIEQVTFRDGQSVGSYQLTLSVGEVSFPHHGHDRQTLLVTVARCLDHAAERGGNRVVYASELEPPGGSLAVSGAGS